MEIEDLEQRIVSCFVWLEAHEAYKKATWCGSISNGNERSDLISLHYEKESDEYVFMLCPFMHYRWANVFRFSRKSHSLIWDVKCNKDDANKLSKIFLLKYWPILKEDFLKQERYREEKRLAELQQEQDLIDFKA